MVYKLHKEARVCVCILFKMVMWTLKQRTEKKKKRHATNFLCDLVVKVGKQSARLKQQQNSLTQIKRTNNMYSSARHDQNNTYSEWGLKYIDA